MALIIFAQVLSRKQIKWISASGCYLNHYLTLIALSFCASHIWHKQVATSSAAWSRLAAHHRAQHLITIRYRKAGPNQPGLFAPSIKGGLSCHFL